MFKLEIDTSNDAFVLRTREEIARILRVLADSLLNAHPEHHLPWGLYDRNGNRVGIATLETED